MEQQEQKSLFAVQSFWSMKNKRRKFSKESLSCMLRKTTYRTFNESEWHMAKKEKEVQFVKSKRGI
jgi:hypothetical protein